MTDEERDAKLHKLGTANTVLTIIPYTLFIVFIGVAVYASIYFNNKATAYAAEAEALPTLKAQVTSIDEKIKAAPPSNVAIAELTRRVDALTNDTTELKKRVEQTPLSGTTSVPPTDGNLTKLEQQLADVQKQQAAVNRGLEALQTRMDARDKLYEEMERSQNEIIQGLVKRLNTPTNPDSPVRRVPRNPGRPPG